MSSNKTPKTFIGVAEFGSKYRTKYDMEQMKKFNSTETRFIKETYTSCGRTTYDMEQMKKFNGGNVEKYTPP